ncbi:MAG: hypothetical protein JWN76_672 [Chitinophagaceae bacterium]|nr:hypothetical protein [Chitinophagaceae bacterium]
MLLHNLKQVLRGMLRYKSFTLINLLGLSVSIAAIVIIFLIDDYENRFDDLHSNSNHVFRVVSKTDRDAKATDRAIVPYPLAKLLRTESAGIKATEIHFVKEMNVKIGGNAPFIEKNVVFADSLFFDVLNYSRIKGFWLRGSAAALKEPKKAILTASLAKRYFGNEDPIGKIIRVDNKADIQVAAIIKDIPVTTHLPVSMFVSFSTLTPEFLAGISPDQWGVHSNGFCYVRLPDLSQINETEKALYNVVQKSATNDREKKEKMFLQPLQQIHFDPVYENENPSYTISKKYIDMLLLLGGFILLIACVNYINLSTSLAFSKSKEVGIRKTIGASKAQLFSFYLYETFVITFIAALIGIVIASAMISPINHILDKSVSLTQLLNPKFFIGGILLVVFISFISGAYPAIILAGFNPIDSLKNQLSMPGKSSTLIRKGLVVFQFTTSIALIICTIIISKQVNYFNSKSLGFNKEAVVEVGLPVSDSAKMEAFKNLLQNEPGIQKMSFCLGAPISDNGFSTSMEAPQLSSKTDYSIRIIPCDAAYLETYGIRLVAGRWFFDSEEKNINKTIVINETAVKTLGYKKNSDAIGKRFKIGINDYQPTIVGVTKDFHTTSLHQGITQVGLMPFRYFYYAAGIKIAPASLRTTLAKVENAWRKVYPNDVYGMKFIDETLAARYEQETKDFNLFKAFSGISIFICCIGLWGLIAFVVSRKTKEIGIRKVLGATVNEIILLLSKDFILLVLVALIIASPLAWYFMNKWLNNFAYRINISVWVFVLAGAFAMVIAFMTISFQAIKAALANPVKSLRTE